MHRGHHRVDPEGTVEAARRHGVVLVLAVRPGDVVGEGTPLATAAPREADHVDVDALARELAGAVVLGPERTEEQDVAFGLRQLVDIAIKAISPAVNDPTTAAEALSFCGDLLMLLQQRRLGAQAVRDADGVVRAVLPDRDVDYYFDLVCAQPRRYGRGDPAVLVALLRLLRDCATVARDDAQRSAVRAQAGLVLEEASDGMLDHDARAVRDMARRVELALAGGVVEAYRDRAGETRSI
ncbi:MAG TPA: DUF2254 family protein [Mycobacteriales bacterium]|nr:DUF2254 family protein [Mycobacteriales bacterium]